MSLGFWILQDGRGYSRRIRFMIDLMKSIHAELKLIEGAEAFSQYLSKFLLTEDHKVNSHGEYFNKITEEAVMVDIDFREFTVENQNVFWEAAQSLLNKMIRKNSIKDRVPIKELKLLLDMNKRAIKGENPMNLNHLEGIAPPTTEQKGPGW